MTTKGFLRNGWENLPWPLGKDWVSESETSCGNRDPEQTSWPRQDTRNQTRALTSPHSWGLQGYKLNAECIRKGKQAAWLGLERSGVWPLVESSRLVLGTWNLTALLIFSVVRWGQYYNSHFTNEETENKLNKLPRSHSQQVTEWVSAQLGLIQSTFSFCGIWILARKDCKVSILSSLSLVLLETSCTYLLYSLECGVVCKLTEVDITGKTTS